ncbi:membrane protein required for colicin V production [Oleiagrimonas soli]|uniref:Membrane protein required for colicin V production n=2 Tax=Oleiagrimonas soli TaxID=1543381 RepID=A0A841KF05_9GAMM|nr:membrane protein required for colicin V production [Oleiagrimonas soli]
MQTLDAMNWADYVVLGVIALSVLIGLWRGFVSEVMALVIWIAAFWVAWLFGPSVAGYFEHSIDLPSARMLVGYGLCFLAVLLLGALVRFVIARLVESTGLSGTDRLLGMGFGFVRGVLLVTLAVFLLGFTPFSRDPWWKQSVLLGQAQVVADWLAQRLPDSVRRYVHPDHQPTLPTAAERLPQAVQTGLSGMAGAVRAASPSSAPATPRPLPTSTQNL